MRTFAPLLFTICHRTHRMKIAESIDFGKAPQLAITLSNCLSQAAQATPKGLAPLASCYIRKECLQKSPLQEQRSDLEGSESHQPCEDDGVDCCEEGPFPATGFTLDCDEGCNAWEIQKDEDHVGQSTCWSN